MRRWLEKLPMIAAISLVIHLGSVAALRVFVPPPKYAPRPPSANAELVALQPMTRLQDPPKPVEPEKENAIGEADGAGDSIASLDLPGEMQSETPNEFEQAWTRREPAASLNPQQEQSSSKSAALVPSGLSVELPAMSRQTIARGESQIEAPPTDKPIEDKASEGNANEGEQGEHQKAQTEAKPASDVIEPAPSGENDLDRFADAEGINLGGTKARKGREIKISRPRIDLAFRSAFTRLSDGKMFVAFRVATDEKGRARSVRILRSSGSSDIDEPLKLALYDSWFGGKMPDEFDFVVGLFE